jgi:hypothetical protein
MFKKLEKNPYKKIITIKKMKGKKLILLKLVILYGKNYMAFVQ